MIPPSTTITESGRRIRRALILVAVGIVVLNVAVAVVESFASEGAVSGPSGSTYVTTADGAAALAGTLERLGWEVRQSRRLLDETRLDPASTLVLIDVGDAEYSPAELTTIRRFLEAGGRLVVGGRAEVVAGLIPDPPEWQASGAPSASLDLGNAGPETTLVMSGFGSLDPSSSDVALLSGPEGLVVATARSVGDGLVVWLADSAPFLNATIGRQQSAAGLAALIGPGRTVVFDEFRHGFTEEGGLWQIVPSGWRVALLLGGLTLIITLAAYGRRFGPPQDIRRRLPPDRSAYLEAVAGMMRRGDATADAISVLREEARRRLEERSGVGTDPAQTARHAGLDPEAVAAILGSDSDERTLVAVDRALATLDREKT